MKKGILIQALGHSYYYQMALILAASIKVNEPSMPICLMTNEGLVIRHEHKKLFDIVKPVSKESITTGDKIEYIKAKLYMYDFSPFEETIFLDVDQIVIEGRRLLPIFSELKDVKLSISNTGIGSFSVWAEIGEVKSIYGDKPFWNFHSEFIYFKKSSEVKKYFDTAKQVYNENKITTATKFSAATMADELAFQCASIITGMYPHKENWTPNFWFNRGVSSTDMRKMPYELVGFITYSIGGNTIPSNVKNNYNILAKHYFAKLGLSNPYQVVDKKQFLPERKLI